MNEDFHDQKEHGEDQIDIKAAAKKKQKNMHQNAVKNNNCRDDHHM